MEAGKRKGERCGSMICSISFSSITPLILLLLVFIGNGTFSVSALKYTSTRRIPSLRLARIQRHLEKINKPAVRSIKSPDGDIIDCIYQNKQPALDHPLLKNHKIQRVAPQRPALRDSRRPQNYSAGDAARTAWQTWHHAGHCPKGTIPIRRSSVDDVLRAKSLHHFGKKQQKVDALGVVGGEGHEHAIAYTRNTQGIYGAKTTINVWDPSVQMPSEFSLSQVWISAGSFNGFNLNTIEAGWQVSPQIYGDSKPRLFIYWTTDAYKATGCYNLLCSGFVQINNKIAIGAAISPISSYEGSQYDITLLIWKDPKLGNWWMSFGDDNLVGYWPAELFTHLSERATLVEWGGEVVNMRPNGEHTFTQMGSGHFAKGGFGKASYFRNLEIVDSNNTLNSDHFISTWAHNASCYNIKSFSNTDWGIHFYYGGPGNKPRCR